MRSHLLAVVALTGLPFAGRSQQSESGALGVYADALHGRATASGESYDRGSLTAAHPGLPFGSVVRVANFQSGKMVDVRINDRKPRDSRILVLSGAAARAIGVPPDALAPGACLVVGQAAVSTASATTAGSGAAAAPAGVPSERKFKPLAGLFGKEAVPVAAAPTGTLPSAGTPVQYGIPGSQYAPPASGANSSPFAFLGKRGNSSVGKPSVAAAAYPDPFPVSRTSASAAAGGTILPMNAVSGRAPVPGPAMAPVPTLAGSMGQLAPAPALPPASPSAPYRVQFGAYRRLSSADEIAAMLDGAGIPASVFAAPGTGLNVVVTDAGFRTAEEAQRWVDFEGARRGWTERPVVIR